MTKPLIPQSLESTAPVSVAAPNECLGYERIAIRPLNNADILDDTNVLIQSHGIDAIQMLNDDDQYCPQRTLEERRRRLGITVYSVEGRLAGLLYGSEVCIDFRQKERHVAEFPNRDQVKLFSRLHNIGFLHLMDLRSICQSASSFEFANEKLQSVTKRQSPSYGFKHVPITSELVVMHNMPTEPAAAELANMLTGYPRRFPEDIKTAIFAGKIASK